MTDDATLAAQVRGGNADAFTACYLAHVAALDSHTYRTGTAHWAEDALQQVFARLWERPDRFDPARGTLRTFLQWDVSGRSLDLARSESRRRSREAANQARSAPTVDGAATERVPDAVLVRAAILQLPMVERRTIVLAFYEDLSYKEVAVRLGQPEGTTKTHIRRGLNRLAVLLARDGFGPSHPARSP